MKANSKDNRVEKQRPRLIQELRAELRNLTLACEQWELGHYEQSTSIAKTLRVLLYDYNKDRASLFAQLGLKGKRFVTSGRVQSYPKRTSWQALANSRLVVSFNHNTGSRYIRRFWEPNYFYLDRRHGFSPQSRPSKQMRAEPFQSWWGAIVASNEDFALSRADIVDALCNELGGAHSASKLKPSTAALIQGELDYVDHIRSFSISGLSVDDTNTPVENSMSDAIIRQIAYEFQCSVHRFHRDVVSSEVVPPLPAHWKRADQPVRVTVDDPGYLSKVLADLQKHGEGECVQAKELESEIYWHQYKRGLQVRGL